MSAFIVSDKHILALVEAGRIWSYEHSPQCLDRGARNFQDIVDILINENYRSVNYRYREQEEPHKVTYTPIPMKYSKVDILKACDCYDYQACETPDYEQSQAAKIIHKIRMNAIRTMPGYDQAPWGID